MTNLVEYKVLDGTPHECEEKLNQWKEMYDLTLLRMCAFQNVQMNISGIVILLLRTVPQPGKEKAS